MLIYLPGQVSQYTKDMENDEQNKAGSYMERTVAICLGVRPSFIELQLKLAMCQVQLLRTSGLWKQKGLTGA